ncbi:M1 family metallopeptidase [Mucilaginibacter sp. OK098]|uniref:M1 family metallopeptidase n=1 Tax=Mucilaginibacter sp. OK098 TaxID=1855297 RepID=UPI0009352025|nr:M1 family metallopeptidase [Mucilaginibacter sp. OK098]
MFIGKYSTAQELPVARSVRKAYSKVTRSKSGLPGKLYWQNTGNYNININFNPSTREISGGVTIDYINNSPDTLKTLVFKLYPNLYKNNAMRNMPVASSDLTTGVHISSMTIDGNEYDSTRRAIKGTNMYLKGSRILPGQKAHIAINYSYTLNKGSFIRTGQIDSGAFFIAYFFPRIAVYDDVDGWNEYPYIGKEEFYNDYGNFKVAITLPGKYEVWATGNLENTQEVYKPNIVQRINNAELSDSITDVITTDDLNKGNVTQSNQTNTWRFEADGVTDFAFAVSDHYVWRSSSIMVDPSTKRRTRVDAVFNPVHDAYLPVAAYARKTVELISYHFPALPFPYSHETIFDGLDAMEYPMMVNNLPFSDKKEVLEFTAHEVFHALFPFYVGTNETKFSFMDEGWATMTEFLFPPLIDPAVPFDYDISDVNNSAGTDEDVPIMTPTTQLYGKARFSDKDLKPALGLLYLKEMLGDKLFLEAMRYYIENWNGKHPTPYDFFNCMNTGSGTNLNWFWKTWFFEKNVPDLVISKVTHRQLDYNITISSPGSLPVPIHLTIIYRDGSKQLLSRNIGCWMNGNKSVSLHLRAKKPVTQLVLGDAFDVDINPENNLWNNGHGRGK